MRQLFSSFIEALRLQSEMNKLFEALQGLGSGSPQGEFGFSPPYDIVETPDEVLIEIDLPGIDVGALEVSIQGNVIVVEGSKERPSDCNISAYHLIERDRGHFIRTLRVEGSFNTHKAVAEYSLGVLTLRMPRVKDRRGALIKIKPASEG